MPGSGRIVNVKVTFKNTDISEALREHAVEKVRACLQKFVHHDTEAHLVFKVEKTRNIAELSFRADGADFAAKDEGEDLYASVDALIDSITQQLRKHKEKITDHHKTKLQAE